jgi:hypothetical protein
VSKYSSELQLLQSVVESSVEVVHGGFGFVAHVGETERGAFDLAVAAVDQDALILHEFLHFGDVDDATTLLGTVVHAGEGDGFKAFVREQGEAVASGPVLGHFRELGVTGVTGFETLGEEVVELGSQCIDVADARGARGHVAFGVLLEFDEVEVITAVLDGGGFGQRSRGGGEDREAWRHREGFLRAGEQDVNAELVEFNLRGSQGADSIDDEHDVGIFLLQRSDFFQRAHDAGGGFVVDQSKCVELAGGEFGVDLFGANRRTPFDLESFGLFAAALGDIEPLVREGAAHAVENLLRDEVADGAFHHAPGGGGAEIDQLLGVEQGLQLGLHFGVKIFKALAAMTDHRGSKSAKGFLAYFDGSRNVQFYMCHKKYVKFFTSEDGWQARSGGEDALLVYRGND